MKQTVLHIISMIALWQWLILLFPFRVLGFIWSMVSTSFQLGSYDDYNGYVSTMARWEDGDI